MIYYFTSTILQVVCEQVPDYFLEEILGPAFNARYMSISEPYVEISLPGKKRESSNLDFYVEDNFFEDMEHQPAWLLKNHVEVSKEFGNRR